MLDDLSTDAFINALRCFIAIRGAVCLIKSDQGRNFIGAKNEFKETLKEIDQEKLAAFLVDNQCDFNMNAPYSSHVGGVWERKIRTVRSLLSSTLTLSLSRLDDSSLRTFFYEAMSIINSRPLTVNHLGDPCSLTPITPNHLLTMKISSALPPPGKFVKEDIYARKRWRRVPIGALRVFTLRLLSLCLKITEAQNVDLNTLARIISDIHEVYHPDIGPQYAVAINIPAAMCGPGNHHVAEFLRERNHPPDVKERLNAREIYQSNTMIGATPRNAHSEYRLLRDPDQARSRMMNLLNQAGEQCVIFYTYYSPCTNTCTNPVGNFTILEAIQMFHRHQGPKAFVYNQHFLLRKFSSSSSTEAPQSPPVLTAMVLSGTLHVVLLCLLSLCLRGTEAEYVDQNTLSRIINYIQTNYGFDQDQFAVTISVPDEMCQAGVTDHQIQANLLPMDDSETVKSAMNSENRVYSGNRLIGAKPKPIPGKPNRKYHAEYLLLIQKSPTDPLIKQLIWNKTENCLIFYTYNSPCSNTCSTPKKAHSIIPALNMWFRNYNGRKAFVFRQVWRHDLTGAKATQWKNNIKIVNFRVPLYRCDNTGCTCCVDNNEQIAPQCQRNEQNG
ncbi:hypothetical protein SRHO_G00210910 [Serrasalmus rhombeus]